MNQEELDRAVTEAVRGGANRFSSVISKIGSGRSSVDYRSVDRSLQRLRKKGVLKYSTGVAGWALSAVETKTNLSTATEAS